MEIAVVVHVTTQKGGLIMIDFTWRSSFQKNLFTLVLSIVCLPSAVRAEENSAKDALLRYNYKAGEITQLCESLDIDTRSRLDVFVKSNGTLMEFEKIITDFSDQSEGLTFLKEVSTQEGLRQEAAQCEEKLNQVSIDIFTREDLYNILKKSSPRLHSQRRLWTETLKGFEDNGLALPEGSRAKLKELKQKLSELESQYSTFLNEDNTSVLFTAEELEGVPQDFLSGLQNHSSSQNEPSPKNAPKNINDKYNVPVRTPDYHQILENAKNPETRRRMHEAYQNRAVKTNTAILEEAILLRQEIAKLMGFKTWADYRQKDQMAKNSNAVWAFLNDVKSKVAARNQSDLAEILEFKKKEDPSATDLKAWDVLYYAYQLKKQDYRLDDEEIKEYFPEQKAVSGMFKVYSQLLGVDFNEITDESMWADGVKFYQIRDKKSLQVLGYFYTDFIPRDGKYGHAAAFPLRSGRLLENGVYVAPVSAIVANFTPPQPGKPILLKFSDVETLFHEFGHIMHQTLTRAPFASLAGTRVATDYVEAPSQMFENWIYSPEVLKLISGHYKDQSKELPTEMLQKLIEARKFNQGYFYSRQLVFGIFDLTCHTTEGKVDVTELYKKIHQELVGIPAIENDHFAASFGHIMGGYDAGYYGYLWSEVFAADMFTKFESEGILNPDVGSRYRKWILEQGNMRDPDLLLKEFLGRELSTEAFFKKLQK
jgi:thimet oligopeptidase